MTRATRLILTAAAALFSTHSAGAAGAPPLIEYANAAWWDGRSTDTGSRFVRGEVFVDPAGARTDEIIDLGGAFVTAPFAEGHNHNLMEKIFDKSNAAYLEQGVFYVKIPAIYPPAVEAVRNRLARPDTVDAVFSFASLTCPGGHPVDLFVDVLSGVVYEKLGYDDFSGRTFIEVDNNADIKPALDTIAALGSDFVKVLLLYSEDYGTPAQPDCIGIDPEFVPAIVTGAHERGLPVMVHVQSAFDFNVAVAAGADEIAHLPGYSWPASQDAHRHRITEAEAEAAAEAGVAVLTTTSFPRNRAPDEDRQSMIMATQAANLAKLDAAGVELRIGSDIYDRTGYGEDRHSTRAEVLHVIELGVLDADDVLARWIDTGRTIFPDRRISCFAPGCEASFLVFDSDPRADLAQLSSIRRAIKQGIDVLP